MVELNFAHICDNAFLSQEGKINIIGDFESIYTKPIPDTNKIFHSLFMVTNFTVSPAEYTQKTIIRNKKDNKEILNNESKRIIDKPGRIGFISNFGVIFPEYGNYIVEIYINNEIKISLPLNVLESKIK